MRNSRVRAFSYVIQRTVLVVGLVLMAINARSAESQVATSGVSQGGPDSSSYDCNTSDTGSPYIPVDSWIYPAVLRLYSLGFVDTVYLGMRPWTRSSLNHMIEEASSRIEAADAGAVGDEAQGIYESLIHAMSGDVQGSCPTNGGNLRLDSVYSGVRIITGHPLRDSYHIGESIVNNYGRPYANGINNSSGASGYMSAGRFVLYVRGEFQGAPSTVGYPSTLAGKLAAIDGTTDYFNSTIPIPYNAQATIPAGPIGTKTNGRLIEAYASAHYLNHEISFGKQDDWLGPAVGGGMAYSNNAENIYSFRINRVEPLQIPLLSRITGPFRYEFLIGPLKGHIYPRDPWLHVEKISFKPTENLEFGFERSVIWGGKGHEPVNLHTFLKSFFSLTNVTAAIKDSPQDPGARFGAFDFSYRLPFLRNWLTLYTDSEAHDDVSPPSAPTRAAYRPGLYLSHVPGIAKLDLRVEAVSTDPPSERSNGGQFNYFEGIERQGYTNSGQIIGDWIGREAKGGQGWITYHLSGNEWIQANARAQKTPKDFIPGGTTLNDINFQVVKRIGKDFEINGNFTYEHWKAPIYLPGQQTMTDTTIQVTWFPERRVSF
jgi:Capsule assembly protein Wzi